MRHSTLELTGRYTRPRAVDINRATVPTPVAPMSPACEVMAATGTEPVATATASATDEDEEGNFSKHRARLVSVGQRAMVA